MVDAFEEAAEMPLKVEACEEVEEAAEAIETMLVFESELLRLGMAAVALICGCIEWKYAGLPGRICDVGKSAGCPDIAS